MFKEKFVTSNGVEMGSGKDTRESLGPRMVGTWVV